MMLMSTYKPNVDMHPGPSRLLRIKGRDGPESRSKRTMPVQRQLPLHRKRMEVRCKKCIAGVEGAIERVSDQAETPGETSLCNYYTVSVFIS
jgi:hypothetical protein